MKKRRLGFKRQNKSWKKKFGEKERSTTTSPLTLTTTTTEVESERSLTKLNKMTFTFFSKKIYIFDILNSQASLYNEPAKNIHDNHKTL